MKTKSKIILSSLLIIALCVSVIAGATFALFTDNDSVNIAVTSGKVAVTAKIDKSSVKVSSMGRELSGNTWENGGQAGFTAKDELELSNITPGDGASFNIDITNESTVNIMYRVTYKVNGLLADVLEISVKGASYGWTAWNTSEGTTKTAILTVKLPQSVGNEYQDDDSTTISFAVEAVQGNGEVCKYASDTDEAQALLDNAEDGDTIVLRGGTYGKLHFRPSSKSVFNETGYTSWSNLLCYDRFFNNITIRGEEGATVTVNGFVNDSTLYNVKDFPQADKPVQDDNVGTFSRAGYYFNNITFQNLILSESIYFTEGGWAPIEIKNVNIIDCKTADDLLHNTNTDNNKLISSRANITNLVVSGCQVTNRFQGVFVQNAKNVTVEDCVFDTLVHNAIAIQTGCSGKIVLQNNVIKNCNTDRIIRFDVFNQGSISIIGNKLINSAGDKDGQLCKATSIADGVSVLLANNEWGENVDLSTAIVGMGAVEEINLIMSADQLVAFAQDVNSGNYQKNKTVKLGSDINLEGIDWQPIGNVEHPFAGTFDGQNHTISNLTVIAPDSEYVGLFGVLGLKNFAAFGNISESKHNEYSAVIRNLTLKEVNVAGQGYVSAVAGMALGTNKTTQSEISNVNVIGGSVSGGHYVGGIAGQASVNITNCHVENLIVSATPYEVDGNLDNGDKAGGVVGYLVGGWVTMTGCSAKDVTVKAFRDAGGLVGMDDYSNYHPYNSVTPNHAAVIIASTVQNITLVELPPETIGSHKSGENMNETVGRLGKDAVPDVVVVE